MHAYLEETDKQTDRQTEYRSNHTHACIHALGRRDKQLLRTYILLMGYSLLGVPPKESLEIGKGTHTKMMH